MSATFDRVARAVSLTVSCQRRDGFPVEQVRYSVLAQVDAHPTAATTPAGAASLLAKHRHHLIDDFVVELIGA